jgi:hypothetical protein
MKTATALLIATLVSLPLAHAQSVGKPAQVKPPVGMAEFQKMKYGFFVHYVWGGGIYPVTIRKDGALPKGLDDLANRFDATGFANDCASMGVEYVLFTAWHANMNVLYPSKAMDRWLPGHASKRDLIGDMIKACKAKNIPVLLYTHPRDGHDFTKEEQDRTGWVDGGSPNPDFEKFDKQKWNDFINDVYGELVERYGKDILGLYLDEGSGSADSQRVVDYPRLRKTITAKHPHLLMMQNTYGSLYTCDIGNQEVFYSGHFANPDGNQWPSFNIPISLVVGSVFWAAFAEGQDAPANPHPKLGFNKWIPYTPEQMFRYNVLQAGSNTDGGGVLWCAGPYADGGWETGVLDRMQRTGKLIQAVAPSIKQTYPSTSYPTAPGTNIAALTWGVATQSTDGRLEYLHVLKPPTGSKSLKLPPPADGKKFSKAVLLKSRKPVALQQSAEGVEVTLPVGEDWDPLDTVIALQVTPDATPVNLALRKPFRASSLDGKSYAMLAVDGDANSAWVSASDDPAPSGFVDLGEVRTVSKIEIEGRIPGGSVLQASDDFSFANAKPLATSPAFKAMALEIVKASYGKGDKWVDVTEKLRAAADADGINVQMGISLAGVDPAPYVVKETKVEYTLDGKPGSVTVTEDGLLSLGAPQGWTVELPKPVTTRFLRIAREQPGRCAIAEIRVFGPAK